jgi:myo-inositol 2-dehydrogenase/D-chiro-inositol 1-dehydrogenase
MTGRVGIGILGAGQVTQAIHLPTLATLADRFVVQWVMDVDPGVAENVAGRANAIASTDIAPVLEDPDVAVIVICSPNGLHAEQILAACAAGKKAILCEKPLAWNREEKGAIKDAVRRHGVALFVGTMHAYDPAYHAVRSEWGECGEKASLVHSSICLPANSVFIQQSTEVFMTPAVKREPQADTPEYRRHMLKSALLGLAIHDIPLIRDFYPQAGTMHNVHSVLPYGYALNVSHENTRTVMTALTPGQWSSRWSLTVIGHEHTLEVAFTPSYVLGGSSRARLIGRNSERVFHFEENGYQVLWRTIHEVVDGGAPQPISNETVFDDFSFALDLVEASHRLMDCRL